MSKSQVMCVGCDNPAGKQDAESDGFCEECIAFATDRVTPVAAQAGDEPMRKDFEAWAQDYFFYDKCRQDGEYVHPDMHTHWLAYKAGQVSPRATADLERDRRLNKIADAIEADGLPNTAAELREIIATTKPGA